MTNALQVRVQPVTDAKEGDVVRYVSRGSRRRLLSMTVGRVVDCGEGVTLLIGQGRTLAGEPMRCTRVATFRGPVKVNILRPVAA